MAKKLSEYAEVVGQDVLDELDAIAGRVRHKKLQNINSTAVGGGVAEILSRMVPLLQELGIEATWDVIKGNDAFFAVTKAFHNALHGTPEQITPEMFEVYRSTVEDNACTLAVTGDVVICHDPQPAPLIDLKPAAGRQWVWRCHIDLSAPQHDVWEFLRPWVERYDAAVFSMPSFAQELNIPQYLVHPSIDPLADKNKDLDAGFIGEVLNKHGIDPQRPVVTQISRFDRLKDPVGVMAAYRMAKRRYDCQLVLAGGGASDDPEGEQVLAEVQEQAADDPDIHVLLLPPFSDLEINALVRGSTIVMQKSIREGFGLTVSEALWKGKPVIGGAVGGIRLQVVEGETGFLVRSVEGAANRLMRLLGDRDLRERMGRNGHLFVKNNFLLTRHVKDYLLLMSALDHPQENVIHLG
ncbi:MAG: glycosyltransferase [Bryobacterales bacterium]|nr:glycosyltransferase [Bryobacterales bacterium]